MMVLENIFCFCKATDSILGTTASKWQTIASSFTCFQFQYYVNLVNERERQIIEKRKQCLHLMEKHITEQLIALEETNKRLKFKLQQRLAKDKVF